MPAGVRYVLACLGLALCVSAFPSAADAQLGGALSEFSFLRLDASARSAALGSSLSAVKADDTASFFYNPALAHPTSAGQGVASYTDFIADSQVGMLAYSHALGEETVVSAGVRYVDWGEFDGRDAAGVPTEAFHARDVGLTVGWAGAIDEHWRYGANLHFLYAAIETARATALAGDVGVQAYWPGSGWSVSTSLHHMGGTLSNLGAERASLPFDWRIGVARSVPHLPVQLSMTGYDLHNMGEALPDEGTAGQVLGHLTFGVEAYLGEVITLRGGYNHRRSRELVLNDRLDWAGVGGGFGVHLGPLRADYAFTSWSSFGGLHQISVQLGPA